MILSLISAMSAGLLMGHGQSVSTPFIPHVRTQTATTTIFPEFSPLVSDEKVGPCRREKSGWYYFQVENRLVQRFDPRLPMIQKVLVAEKLAQELGQQWKPFNVLSTGALSKETRLGLEELARQTDPVIVPGSIAGGRVSFMPQPALDVKLTIAGRTVSYEMAIGPEGFLGRDEARKLYAKADSAPAQLYDENSTDFKRMAADGIEGSPDAVQIRFLGVRQGQDRAVEISESGRILRQLAEALNLQFEQKHSEVLKSVQTALKQWVDENGSLTKAGRENIVRNFEQNYGLYGFGNAKDAGDFARSASVNKLTPALNIIFPVGDAKGYDGLRIYP